MGIYLGLVTLGDENIRRVLDDPPLVWQVIAPDDREFYETARAEQVTSRPWWNPFGRGAPRVAADLDLSPAEGIATDVDKAWHGIHYLLTGTAGEGEPSLDFIVSGGTLVGDLEIGSGPARVLTAAETLALRDALDSIGDEELASRFNPSEMAALEIYPDIWSGEAAEKESLEYLMEYVRVLRGFLEQTTRERLGLVLHLA